MREFLSIGEFLETDLILFSSLSTACCRLMLVGPMLDKTRNQGIGVDFSVPVTILIFA